MTILGTLKAANDARWAHMRVTLTLLAHIDGVADRLLAAKARYQNIAAITHVPWFVIAVIHEREASQSWLANIAQGDPWCKVSTRVPRGRGPFASWEDAAIDALKNCAPCAGRWGDWSAGGALTLLEQYNGLGYAEGPFDKASGKKYPPQASPYIWASTDQYKKGKYITDGHFDPNAIDSQLGCAALIARMMAKDSSVAFTQAVAA